MIVGSIWYLIETIVFALAIIAGVILFGIKHINGTKLFLFITISLFIAIFELFFLLETPKMEIEDNINIEVGTDEKIQIPKTTYHFQDVTDKVVMKGKINYKKIGKYEIEFSVNTINKKYIKKVTVNVIDTKRPELSLNGEQSYIFSYREPYIEPGYTAIDSFEGDITGNVKIIEEKLDNRHKNIIYEVKDSSGNTTTMVRKIELTDNISPEIKINGPRIKVLYLNEEYKEEGATASDELEGDLTKDIKTSGEVNTSKEGTYYVTYEVVDSSGNEVRDQRIVIVTSQEIVKNDFNGQEEIGIIYLTFDDGPSTKITPQVLDILGAKNIKATFFILNYDEEREPIVKREYQEGHSIGIHGYSHDYNIIYESEAAYMDNITKLQEKIKGTTGYSPTITRFPGGSSNTISKFNEGIMTRLTELVVNSGYKYYDWNVSSEDAVGADTPDELYENVVNGLSKSKRNFVLMHDFNKNEAIVEALPRIINYGKENGYIFEKITDETPMLTHRVFN